MGGGTIVRMVGRRKYNPLNQNIMYLYAKCQVVNVDLQLTGKVDVVRLGELASDDNG